MKFKKYQLEKLSELLKSVRKERNISINELSIKTKIQKDYIIDIEEGNYDNIPPGPYLELFVKDIFSEFNIDFNEYIEDTINKPEIKEEEVVEKETGIDTSSESKEPIIEEKISVTNKTNNIKYLSYAFAFAVLVLIFVVYKTFLPSVDVQQQSHPVQQQSHPVQQVEQKNIEDSLVESTRNDSLAENDSIMESVVQEDFLDEPEEEEKAPRLAITRNKEWTIPPGIQITRNQLNSRYNKGNLIEISAARGEVRLKYITRDDFWWKVLEKGESISFRIDEAILLEMFYPDNADMKYLGEPQEVGGAKYIRYVIGINTGMSVRDVYQ